MSDKSYISVTSLKLDVHRYSNISICLHFNKVLSLQNSMLLW